MVITARHSCATLLASLLLARFCASTLAVEEAPPLFALSGLDGEATYGDVLPLENRSAPADRLFYASRFAEFVKVTDDLVKWGDCPLQTRILRVRAHMILGRFDKAKAELQAEQFDSVSDRFVNRMRAVADTRLKHKSAGITLDMSGLSGTGPAFEEVLAGWLSSESDVKDGGLTEQPARNQKNHPTALFRSVVLLLGSGKKEEAVHAALRLTSSHPNLSGEVVQPQTVERNLDLSFGLSQVNQFLKDRPVCTLIRDGDPKIANWLSRQFGGATGQGPILWNPDNPLNWSRASHGPPTATELAFVAVDKMHENRKRTLSHDEVFSSLVFELFNFRNSANLVELARIAKDGKVHRDDFALGIAAAEYTAALQSRAFYLKVYYPWAVRNAIATDPAEWNLTICNSIEEQAILVYERDGYPFAYYGPMYDGVRAGTIPLPEPME